MQTNILPPQTTITAALPAGLNNIGDVDIASIAAGETHIGAFGGNTVSVDVAVAMTTAGLYAAGDFVGTDGVAVIFPDCVRLNAGMGVIQSVALIDYAKQAASLELWLFDTAVVPPADSAAWTVLDASVARLIGIVPFTTWYSSALNSVAVAPNVGIAFKTLAGSRRLYGCVVNRGAPTYASGDLIVRLIILQD